MNLTMEELVEQYGDDNVEYLYETLCQGTRNYSRFTWIPMGVEPPYMEQTARQKADERGWRFETVPGDMPLIRKLVNGDWNSEDFLTVPPGSAVKATYDGSIVACK